MAVSRPVPPPARCRRNAASLAARVATKSTYTSRSRQPSRGHRRWWRGSGSERESRAVQQPVQADALRRVTPLAVRKRRAASRARLNVAFGGQVLSAGT